MRPSGPGVWGVCGPPAVTGDTHRKKLRRLLCICVQRTCAACFDVIAEGHVGNMKQVGQLCVSFAESFFSFFTQMGSCPVYCAPLTLSEVMLSSGTIATFGLIIFGWHAEDALVPQVPGV